MADTTLTPADQDALLTELARLLPSAILDTWEEIHFSYADLTEVSTMDFTVVRPDGSTLRVNPPYKVVRLMRDLRSGMYQAGRGTWFTARYFLEPSGEYRVDFDYDNEPSFDFQVFSSVYSSDLERFPRDGEHIPAWLREKLEAAAAEHRTRA